MKLIELVPRSLPELITQIKDLLSSFPMLDGVNIPDVIRLPLRSHHVALELAAHGIFAIPHIRCIDRPLEETVALARRLMAGGVTHILLVSGDRPKNGAQVWDVNPVQAISAIKSAVPKMTVYAGIDPYRSNFTTELAYIRAKQAAGVDGFFSQPFFDVRLAAVYEEWLRPTPLFIGISPVVSEASKHYWETVNDVIFSPDFELTLPYNAEVARSLIDLADQRSQHVYLMPIKTDPQIYLSLLQK
ncbi:methylenetetrahydrofolate reductase [bacterium]|nr:methylenetetrahydrofolate reductase [bacterium]